MGIELARYTVYLYAILCSHALKVRLMVYRGSSSGSSRIYFKKKARKIKQIFARTFHSCMLLLNKTKQKWEKRKGGEKQEQNFN